MDWNKFARKAAGVVLISAGLGAGVYAVLVAFDVLTFVIAYRRADGMFERYGMSFYAAKLLALPLAVLAGLVTNTILWQIARRKRRWVPLAGAVMAAWFGAMYLVSSPYFSGLFDPLTGEPQAKYVRMKDGTIKQFPRGLKYDPDTRRPLQDFDTATAEEYARQQGAPHRQTSRWNREGTWNQLRDLLPWSTTRMWDEKGTLYVTIEGIQVASDRTVLILSSEGGRNGGKLYPTSTTSTYLTDGRGRSYEFVRDTGDYGNTEAFRQSFLLIPLAPTVYALHYVRPDEVYRFQWVFQPLSPEVQGLKLHHERLGTIRLDTVLRNAERGRSANDPHSPLF